MAGSGWNNQLVALLIISAGGGFSGLFIYSPTPGAGNLVLSVAGQAGTDPFGNPYPSGLTVGAVPNPQIQLTSQGGVGFENFLLNNAAFLNGLLSSGLVSNFAALDLQGPARTLAGFTDKCRVQLNTSDGISSSANVQYIYTDLTGTDHTMGAHDFSGFNLIVTSQVTAANPTTGLSNTNVAQQETWHDMRPLSNSFIGTIAGQPPPQYRKCADGDIEFYGMIQTPPTTGNYNGVVFATLPAAYRPNKTIRYVVTQVADGAATPVVSIQPSGQLILNFLPASLAQTIIGIGCRYPLDNTGIIQS